MTLKQIMAISAIVVATSSAESVSAQNAQTAAIDSTIQRLMSLNVSPGLGVVVVRDTQIIYMKGFGFADVETRRPFDASTVSYTGSHTKAFTGLAMAVLDQQGLFDLDAPLSRYLPKVKLAPGLNADSITIRSLLTHTHGIGNSGPVVTRLAFTGEYKGDAELMTLLVNHGPASTGRAFVYGNLGYNVAAMAMDAHLGRGWKETLQRVVLDPLGLKNTSPYVSRFPQNRLAMPYRFRPQGFVRHPYGKIDANMQSAGGHVTTLEDMGKWLEVNINAGRLNGRQVLPAAAFREAHKISVALNRPAGAPGTTQLGYGLGWHVLQRGADTLLLNNGGFPGFMAHMSFMPQKRVGVAVLMNNNELGPASEFLAYEIYRILDGGAALTADSADFVARRIEQARQSMAADLQRRATRPQTLPHPLAAYTGAFDNPLFGRLELREVNGKLEARMGAAWSAIEVYDHTQNQLRIEIFGDGEIVSVEMLDGRAQSLTFGGKKFVRAI
jgi:CubicO group peptidase (beta-lactamase class C family)